MGDNSGWKYEKDKPSHSSLYVKGSAKKGLAVAYLWLNGPRKVEMNRHDGYHATLQSMEENINKVDARLRCDEVSNEGTTCSFNVLI